jgi:hypothetical protein
MIVCNALFERFHKRVRLVVTAFARLIGVFLALFALLIGLGFEAPVARGEGAGNSTVIQSESSLLDSLVPPATDLVP